MESLVKYSVFISSALKFNEQFREQIIRSVYREGGIAIAMESDFYGGNVDTLTKLRQYIDDSDWFIFFGSVIYGSIVTGCNCSQCVLNNCPYKSDQEETCKISYAHYEYLYALQTKGLKRITIIMFQDALEERGIAEFTKTLKAEETYECTQEKKKCANHLKNFYDAIDSGDIISVCNVENIKGVIKDIWKQVIKELGRDARAGYVRKSSINDGLLRLMDRCISGEGEYFTVGEYIVKSGEMTTTKSGDELHILTNEFANYDFTPMASLAISVNSMKGVHYYYYCTDERDVATLKERVKKFYIKDKESRGMIVSWIRWVTSKDDNYGGLFRSNYDEGKIYLEDYVSSIVRDVVSKKELVVLIQGIIKELQKNQDIVESEIIKQERGSSKNYINLTYGNIVTDWLNGKEIIDGNNRNKFYASIDFIKIIADCLEKYNKYNKVAMFIKKAEHLFALKQLTEWQTGNRGFIYPNKKKILEYLFDKYPQYLNDTIKDWLLPPEPSMTDDLKNVIKKAFQQSKEEVKLQILESIKNRSKLTYDLAVDLQKYLPQDARELVRILKPLLDEYSGEIELSDEDITVATERIHFCKIIEDVPSKLCYNFCLFLYDNGEDSAWYTTNRKNTSSLMDQIDNVLFMFKTGHDKTTNKIFNERFLEIIKYNKLENELKNSKLGQYLNNV